MLDVVLEVRVLLIVRQRAKQFLINGPQILHLLPVPPLAEHPLRIGNQLLPEFLLQVLPRTALGRQAIPRVHMRLTKRK